MKNPPADASKALRMWAQEFTEKGIYVFADSKDATQLTVVAVKAASESCKDPDSFIQSMTTASLSAVGIVSQAKGVRPNWTFIIGTFVVLLTFNFAIVAAFVYLHNRNAAQMKQASGQGDVSNIYYDKVQEQEARDRERRSCFSRCGRRTQVDEAEGAKKASGPRYSDLTALLEDFKRQYEVLRRQLDEEERDRPDEDEDEDLRAQEDLLDERIRALQELKAFVRENQACLREYLGIRDDESG